MDGASSVHQVNRQGGREGGSNGINTDRDPPIQVVEGTSRARDLVNAAQGFLPELVLGRIGTDGDYKC